MSKTQELINQLGIPEGTKYPTVDFCINGNVFSVIGAVTEAWRPVNEDVSNRIFSVVNECGSYEEALAFLTAISTVEYNSDNDYSDEE
jgi:aerobic-type carbon monoxide dehydrogenase small subunit (CoxS/CutS family)